MNVDDQVWLCSTIMFRSPWCFYAVGFTWAVNTSLHRGNDRCHPRSPVGVTLITFFLIYRSHYFIFTSAYQWAFEMSPVFILSHSRMKLALVQRTVNYISGLASTLGFCTPFGFLLTKAKILCISKSSGRHVLRMFVIYLIITGLIFETHQQWLAKLSIFVAWVLV